MSFVSFLQKKKTSPLLFFLERQNGQLAREAQVLRRTDAGTSCVVVGRNTTRVCLPPPPCLCPCPPRLRACFPVQADLAKENHLRLSFFSALQPLSPTCNTKRTSSFFLEEKKQKKIICGTVTSLRSCRFRQPATQNGRFVCEPSVFSLQAGCTGNRLSPERHPLPQCLLFLFFKKRNRPLSEEKKTSPLEEKKTSP